jgi:heavy metal translocating P-type ATPase
MTRRRFDAALLAVTLIALLTGGVLWLMGDPTNAGIAWAAGTGVVLLALLVIIVTSLARGEFGLDIIAALSMGGSLLVGETLAGNVIALMFSGGQMLESLAQQRAAREMTALLARVPRTATRKVGDALEQVPLEDLAPGDLLLVRPGEVVAVDGSVEAGDAQLDEAALTGESLPVTRRAGEAVMSGSANAGPAFVLVASRPASESTYAGIVRLVEAAQQSKAPMARLADRYALGFLLATVALTGATWLFTHDPVRTLAVLVVATPCPLILAVPVAIVAGLSRAASHGVLVKSARALEAMARVKTLLIDKTGTLTAGEPAITAIVPRAPYDEDGLLQIAASLAQGSQHVVSAALVKEAHARGIVLAMPEGVEEEHGAGLHGRLGSRTVVLGTRDFVMRNVVDKDGLDDDPAAGRLTTQVGADGRHAGWLVMADELRADAMDTLESLRAGGIERIVVVTGDRADVAARITEGLGIDRVVADATPAGKVAVVQEEHKAAPVLMVGDGVNDAPALAAADVGVAMGARGAAASSEAADAVILVDSLARLPLALGAARRARAIAVQSIAWGMGLSLAAMVAAALGHLTPLQGALIQEAIDVAVVLNALRALTGGPVAHPRPVHDDGGLVA